MTILVQSLLIFVAIFLLCVLPHLLDHTYATLREGAALPALTEWVREVVPADLVGVLCLATGAAITNICIGLMLIVTASTALTATQRTIFLTMTTWGTILVGTILLLVALAIPFISTTGRLPTDEEMNAAAARSRKWIIWSALYCIALVGTTALICRKKRKVEP